MWRILTLIGGFTVLATGIGVLSDPDCQTLDIGGTRRQMSFTCYDNPVRGAWSQGTAGWLAVAGGLLLIGLPLWSFYRTYRSSPFTHRYVPSPDYRDRYSKTLGRGTDDPTTSSLYTPAISPPTALATLDATGLDDSKLCPFCAEAIRSAAIKCKHCGEFLEEPPNGSNT